MSANDTLIEVQSISKRYFLRPQIRPEEGGLLKADHLWALKNVSFNVESGETIGILGRNGSGKSTLLKILSRITRPTEGCAILQGQVSSLLDIGTGFHPELSGRRNIYLKAAFLGMNRHEAAEMFHEILEFSGIGGYIEMPVKYYSSGMYVRLAFAVCAHIVPDIMIIDEVLAVGDLPFQQKCIERINLLRQQGTTFILVSHALPILEKICSRMLVLEHGKLEFDGPPTEAIQKYASYCAAS